MSDAGLPTSADADEHEALCQGDI